MSGDIRVFQHNQMVQWQSVPFHVTSLEVHGDLILFGTSQGFLLVYKIPEDRVSTASFETSRKDFLGPRARKTPVVQLQAVPEFDLLLSLADGYVHLHSLSSYEYLGTIEKSKGTLQFETDVQITGQTDMDSHRRSAQREALSAMRPERLTLRLCTVMKRKMSIFTFDFKTKQFVTIKELATPDTCKSVAWAGKQLIAGYRKEYDLVDIETGRVEQLPTEGRGCSEPLASRLPFNLFALLLEGDRGASKIVFKNMDGKPQREYGIEWSDRPRALETHEPFIVALTERGVEVRFDDSTFKLIQKIPLHKPMFMAHGKHFLIGSEKACWLLVPSLFDHLVNDMMQMHLYLDAKKIAARIDESSEERDVRLRNISIEHAYHEFRKKNFEGALKLLQGPEYPPMNVLCLYDWLLPRMSAIDTKQLDMPELTDDERRAATLALSKYLTEKRGQLMRGEDNAKTPDEQKYREKLMKIVDTTQLRCYIKTQPQLIPPFMRVINHCDIIESEKMLKAAHMEKDLIELYQRRGYHQKALDLLRLSLQNAADASEERNSINAIVAYLQKLKNEDTHLVTQYAGVVLDRDQEKGMTIFISENYPSVKDFDRVQVMEFLKSYPSKLVQFLEHAIFVWGDETKKLRTELALAYCTAISTSRGQRSKEAEERLLNFLKESTPQTLDASQIIGQITTVEGLYHAKALLLGLLNRHEEAIMLITKHLPDFATAEQYCLKYYQKNKLESEGLFKDLLRNYLHPQKDGVPNVDYALIILKKHADKVDAEEALELLPPTTKVKDLQDFLVAILKQREEKRRAVSLVRHLVKTEQLQVTKKKIAIHSKHFKVTEDSLCAVCRKPLRTHAFAIYPCGTFLHLHCMKEDSTCPRHNEQGKCRLTLA